MNISLDRSAFIPDVFKSITVRQWLVVILLIVSSFHLLRQHILRRNYPPIPWNLPLLGNLPWIIWTLYWSGVPPYECLRRLRYKYGNVFALNLCGQLVVFVNDFASIKEAFNNTCLCDRPEILKFKKLNGNKGIAFANGTAWTQQRRFTQTTFRSLGVGKTRFEELIAIETDKLIEAIKRYDGAMFDPQDLLLNVSSNVINLAIFGKRYEYDDEEFLRLQRLTKRQAELLVRIFPFMFLSFLQYIPSIKAVREFEANSPIVSSFIHDFIQEHKTHSILTIFETTRMFSSMNLNYKMATLPVNYLALTKQI
ncbi:cytochrome P450 2J6-like [Amphiura filiformis]|uniref:cytochrome P450 2J6-like n=1 Tax=Amphiura filiformis TaxID=82378 RepID=UPI003B21D4CE